MCFGWSLVVWSSACRSCAPDDACLAASPGVGGFDTTHTFAPCWAAGSYWGRFLSGRAKFCTSCGLRHSAARRKTGLVCWQQSALIGQGRLDGEQRTQRMWLSCRRDWRAPAETPGLGLGAESS